jgi:hypothetical protein
MRFKKQMKIEASILYYEQFGKQNTFDVHKIITGSIGEESEDMSINERVLIAEDSHEESDLDEFSPRIESNN